MREEECRQVKLESAKKAGEGRIKEGLEVPYETQRTEATSIIALST